MEKCGQLTLNKKWKTISKTYKIIGEIGHASNDEGEYVSAVSRESMKTKDPKYYSIKLLRGNFNQVDGSKALLREISILR